MALRANAVRSGIIIDLTSAERQRLERISKGRITAQKHIWRAEIVLLSADGVGTSEIMSRTDTSKTCALRWQERFMNEGVKGLLRHKARPSRIPALTPEVVAWVATRTHEEPPGEATNWTASLMAAKWASAPVQFTNLARPRASASPHSAVQAV